MVELSQRKTYEAILHLLRGIPGKSEEMFKDLTKTTVEYSEGTTFAAEFEADCNGRHHCIKFKTANVNMFKSNLEKTLSGFYFDEKQMVKSFQDDRSIDEIINAINVVAYFVVGA